MISIFQQKVFGGFVMAPIQNRKYLFRLMKAACLGILFTCRLFPLDREGVPQPGKSELFLLGLEKTGARMPLSWKEPAENHPAPFQISLLRENGLREAFRETWKAEEGALLVDYYLLQDGKAAYSSYTFLKPQSAPSLLEPGKPAETEDGIFFWQSNLLVRVRSGNKDPGLNRKAFNFASFLARAVSMRERADLPPLMNFLPEKGVDTTSQHYVLGKVGLEYLFPEQGGDWPGFEDSAEIAVSDYRLEGKTGRLFLIGYPNYTLARHHFERIQARFHPREDQGGRFLLRQNRLLAAVLTGDLSKEQSDELLQDIEYSYTVKWIYDQRPPVLIRSESVSMIGVVVRSLLLLLLMALFAVFCGLAIGGGLFLARDHQSGHPMGKRAKWRLIRIQFNR